MPSTEHQKSWKIKRSFFSQKVPNRSTDGATLLTEMNYFNFFMRWRHLLVGAAINERLIFQDFSQKSSAWFFQDFRTRWRRGCARATFYKSFEITETTLHTLKCFYFNSILIFLQLKNLHLARFQLSYINFLNHRPTLF